MKVEGKDIGAFIDAVITDTKVIENKALPNGAFLIQASPETVTALQEYIWARKNLSSPLTGKERDLWLDANLPVWGKDDS